MQSSFVFKKIAGLIFIAGIAALLTSCASKPKIETDYDHSIDFSQYKTYAFFNPMGIENPN